MTRPLLLLASALELTSECVIEFFLVLLSKIVGPHPISIESFRFDCVQSLLLIGVNPFLETDKLHFWCQTRIFTVITSDRTSRIRPSRSPFTTACCNLPRCRFIRKLLIQYARNSNLLRKVWRSTFSNVWSEDGIRNKFCFALANFNRKCKVIF